MGIEIRGIAADEFEAAVDVISSAFLERPDQVPVAASIATTWDPARTWLAWDGDRACGTFRSMGVELTLPGGGTLPASAVSAVTVRPTHRRRGILTAMAAREHGALVERGESIAILYASEYRIYGRFGYAPSYQVADWHIAPRATAMRGTAAGSVEHVPADPDAKALLTGIFEAWRPRRAGEITRTGADWDLRLGLRDNGFDPRWKGWVLVHRDAAGTPDGYARYTADPSWEHHQAVGEITVGEMVTLTPDAYADMVRFFVEMDLVAKVKLVTRPEREPLRWLLTNARAVTPVATIDGLWVRLFDVPRALEARAYEREASIVLEVVDDAAWGGTRRLALDVGPGGATCRATDRAPDLTLPVAALGGAYLGGNRLRDIVLATGADEHRAGALAEADALLRTADGPGCSTFF